MTPIKPILFLTNTQTGQKEPFAPADPNNVSMYVCGVTPYDHAHLGHGRCYVNFDVIYRTLRFLGYKVRYVRNVTDVDDKIVKKAHTLDEGMGDLQQRAHTVAQRYMNAFAEDMNALHTCTPDDEPRVSDHIDKIITFISDLIDRGHAYESHGDVYFSIESLPSYGALSGRTLEDLQAGARVEVSEAKRNPADFALWKGGVDGAFWKSPWGPGRPGWHIECSSFVYEFLGETIDIHGGGQDLVFPHHENEKAQSEALTQQPFTRHWLHNAHVRLKNEKMSKSLGNVKTLRDIFKEHDPAVLRFYFLQHHYRTPIDFDPEHLTGAARAYRRLIRALNVGTGDGVAAAKRVPNLTLAEWLGSQEESELTRGVVDALCDDFNTPKLLGLIFGALDTITADKKSTEAITLLLQGVLGLPCVPLAEGGVALTPEIEALVAQREAARQARDWAEADRLRNELKRLGYQPKDGKA